jgi:hypothetical protein
LYHRALEAAHWCRRAWTQQPTSTTQCLQKLLFIILGMMQMHQVQPPFVVTPCGHTNSSYATTSLKQGRLSKRISTPTQQHSSKTHRGRPKGNNERNPTQQSAAKTNGDIKSYKNNFHLPWFDTGYRGEPAGQIDATIIQPTGVGKKNSHSPTHISK